MIISSTTLAYSTGAGSVTVAAISGAVMATVTMLGIRHHKQVFAWMKWSRRVDDSSKDLDDADSYLKEVFEKVCEVAQKPCRENDVASLARLRGLLKGVAKQMEVIKTELDDVVVHIERHEATRLPTLTGTMRIAVAEHRAQLECAMKQEHIRMELEQAVIRAQQRIRLLRKV
ncbi:hypothetical protein RB200_29345 [Streptomyces sp. PmtG]